MSEANKNQSQSTSDNIDDLDWLDIEEEEEDNFAEEPEIKEENAPSSKQKKEQTGEDEPLKAQRRHKRKKKSFLFSFPGLLVLTALGGGGYYYMYSVLISSAPKSPNAADTPVIVLDTPTQVTPLETAKTDPVETPLPASQTDPKTQESITDTTSTQAQTSAAEDVLTPLPDSSAENNIELTSLDNADPIAAAETTTESASLSEMAAEQQAAPPELIDNTKTDNSGLGQLISPTSEENTSNKPEIDLIPESTEIPAAPAPTVENIDLIPADTSTTETTDPLQENELIAQTEKTSSLPETLEESVLEAKNPDELQMPAPDQTTLQSNNDILSTETALIEEPPSANLNVQNTDISPVPVNDTKTITPASADLNEETSEKSEISSKPVESEPVISQSQAISQPIENKEQSKIQTQAPEKQPIKKSAKPNEKKQAQAKEKPAPTWKLRSAQSDGAMIYDPATGNLQSVGIGDFVKGIGKIRSITQENGRWVVRGTTGNIRQ